MNLEKLSAKNLDDSELGIESVGKTSAAEYLRESRDVLTPFIGSYVASVKENETFSEALEGLRYVGYKGKLSPNFYGLLTALDNEPGIQLRDINDICNNFGDDESEIDLAYRQYLDNNKIKDSEKNKPAYLNLRSRIQSLLDVNSLGNEDINFRTLKFIQENSSDVRLNNRWDNLHLGMGTKVFWGTPLSGRNDLESFPPVLVFPVGEYGAEVTEKIYRTIQMMLSQITSLEQEAADLAEKHTQMLAGTARGAEDLKKSKDLERSVVKILQEGIVTLGQSITQLIFTKVSGYEDDPDSLIEEIIKNELPNQLGYLAPPALIGPLSLLGLGIFDLVQNNLDDGELKLNPDILEEFQVEKENIVKKRYIHKDECMPAVGRGCPVSFKGKGIHSSGINELSSLFLKLYQNNSAV